jgi:hypothetical protein
MLVLWPRRHSVPAVALGLLSCLLSTPLQASAAPTTDSPLIQERIWNGKDLPPPPREPKPSCPQGAVC